MGAAFLAIFLDLPADFFLGADFFAEDFLEALGFEGDALGLEGEALGLAATLGLGAALDLETLALGAALGFDLDAALLGWIDGDVPLIWMRRLLALVIFIADILPSRYL